MDPWVGQDDPAPAGVPLEGTLLQGTPLEGMPVAEAPGRRRRGGLALVAAGVALAVGLLAGGAAWSAGAVLSTAGVGSVGQGSTASNALDRPPGGGLAPDGGSVSGLAATDAPAATPATAAEQVGVVTIVTTLGYADAKAAGTGIVLTADGVVLTNNHVIEGATSIEVTVESTGAVYGAKVVGTDATADVAVLRLDGADGLVPAAIDKNGVAVGDAIAAIGNAEGGGDLMAAAGTVTALGQTITTQSEGTTAGHTLSDLLQLNADVVSGDSGGAVLDAQGDVVGMTTAASSGSEPITGYAIGIEDALAVADQIRSGVDTTTITIGYPGFLGVQIGSAAPATTGGLGSSRGGGLGSTAFASGATVVGVFPGTPAADAGLAAGDTITAVGGTAVDSADALSTLLAGHAPGDRVVLTWTSSATGVAQTATVTLVAGPAD